VPTIVFQFGYIFVNLQNPSAKGLTINLCCHFDGANIWVANNGIGYVTKIRASDGYRLDDFRVDTGPAPLTFDGANIWVANSGDNTGRS